MKKILFSIIAIVALAYTMPASAQLRLGAVAGVDITTLKFDQKLITVDQSVGYTAGVIGELMLPGIGFGIDASLLYTQQGATLHLGEKPVWALQGYGTQRSYLHYIEIPINVRFKYTNLNGIENTIAPFVFAGPSFSFLLAHNKLEALDYAGGTIAINVGIGFELYKNIQVAGSYAWGMTYAEKTKLLDGYGAQNRTWKVTVAYMF
ncbi:MAG: porin family protein [Muribaculaceae bacterium]